MAEVSYKGQAPKEPKVNVTGIPQSQYEGNPAAQDGGGGGGEGGLSASFQKHKWWWIAGGAGAIILFILWYNNRVSTGTVPSTTTTDTSGTAGLPGSQADANYQQLQYTEDTNTALLQSILNTLQGNQPGSTTTSPPTSPSNPPAGSPPSGSPPLQGGNPPRGGTVSVYGQPPSNPWTPWITSAQGSRFSKMLGQPFLGNIYTGEQFQYEGLWTTIGAGSGGRVWEVPGKVSASQFNQTPIGQGQKQLLYQR